jgi:hypothetical protein
MRGRGTYDTEIRTTFYLKSFKQRNFFEDPKQDGRIIYKSREVMYENAVWIYLAQDKNH